MDLVAYGPEAWIAMDLDEPWEWASAVRHAVIPGVIEVQPGAHSVAVLCRRDRAEQIARRLRSIRSEPSRAPVRATSLDVIYDAEQLTAAAEVAGLDPNTIVFRHTAASYQVQFLAERPGSPFLGPVDSSLQLAPRDTFGPPLAAGTVLLRGSLCSVLTVPMETDGYPIGRVTEPLWSREATPMAKLHAGQHVRFKSV